MMKRGLVLFALLLLGVLVGVAQDLSQVQRTPATVFNIPFAFYADKMVMPAGTYAIRPNFEGTEIELRNTNGPKVVLVRAITTLSARPTLTTAAVAFDVVGQNYYLSEFYVPGMDGLAFNGAPGKHKHEVIVPKA